MKSKNGLIIFVLTGILYLAVFLFSINLPTDPDLGWHLKYGEYFFRTGTVLRENIYSTMMSGYPWTNHSWASDLLIYLSYSGFGFMGISVLGAGIVTLTFFVLSKAFKFSLWNKAIIFPLLLLFVSNVNAVSFRSQMMSYFFTAVLVWILTKYQENPKNLLYTIPLFLIWANFHGGFIVGLIILFGFLGLSKIIELRKNFKISNIFPSVKFELFVGLVVLLATMINPFGYLVYLESLNHFGSPWIKYVSEWAPFENMSQQWWKLILFVNVYLFSMIILFMTGRLKKILPFSVLILLFMALAFNERRYAWSMYYLSVPLLMGLSEYIKPPTKSVQTTVALLLSAAFLLSAFYFKGSPQAYLNMNWNRFCLNASNACSKGAIEFIDKNNLTANLSTPYSWGGWMIWNYPNIKPSIDGRMHLWKDSNGYSAFGEYYTNVQDWESIDKSKYETVVVLKQKKMFKRLKKLTQEGKWEWLYEDNISAVFVRNK
ncbi:MAG: hypothetical protein ACD_37C00258G0001 [uncultured bacterium]|nr:MAG: hypothetical protein ACD_37C00258G0001 [uncultured bacterium]